STRKFNYEVSKTERPERIEQGIPANDDEPVLHRQGGGSLRQERSGNASADGSAGPGHDVSERHLQQPGLQQSPVLAQNLQCTRVRCLQRGRHLGPAATWLPEAGLEKG